MTADLALGPWYLSKASVVDHVRSNRARAVNVFACLTINQPAPIQLVQNVTVPTA